MRRSNGKSKLINLETLFKVLIASARLHQECRAQLLSPQSETDELRLEAVPGRIIMSLGERRFPLTEKR